MTRRTAALAAALLALHLADTATTAAGLNVGAHEAAPPAAAILAAAGLAGLLALDLAATVVQLVCVAIAGPLRPVTWTVALMLAAFPVANNAAVLAAVYAR